MLEPLLKQAGELPSLPEVYIRVTELLETESATGQKIGEAVQTDPVLTARILKLINSAYYGLQKPGYLYFPGGYFTWAATAATGPGGFRIGRCFQRL
jgi:c-di-GMP-related signal transduction protein